MNGADFDLRECYEFNWNEDADVVVDVGPCWHPDSPVLGGRQRFANAERPAPFPSAIVYFGPNVGRFYGVFSSLGGIFVRVNASPGGAG